MFDVELKVKGGHITDEQKDFKYQALRNGYLSIILDPKYEVQEAFEIVVKQIEDYLNLTDK